jgi:hypothetical protein
MRIAVFVAAGLVVFTTLLHAQSDDDDDDEDTAYSPLVPTGNSMRFGLRYVGGPKVSFHDVGTIPATVPAPDPSYPSVHYYNDGQVNPDQRVDSSNHPLNDGMTNDWSVYSATQIVTSGNTSGIAFHTYSTTALADGQTIKASNALAEGWELEAGHRLGRLGRKVDLSLVAGFSFSSFNSKRSGYVYSQLTTITDLYSLNGQAPPTTFPYTQTGTGTVPVYDGNNQPKIGPTGTQTTTSVDNGLLLPQRPTSSIPSNTNADGTPTQALVLGQWQVKGAYYSFRMGPLFEMPLTERLKLSLRVGGVALIVASNYTANEVILVDNVNAPLADVETKTHTVLLPGWYADAGAEYWLTERAGFYLDATYQRSQAFNQNLGGRTATIDMTSTSGLTSGLTLRF